MSEKLPGIKHIIATSSGKGGVGKSTVSINLALALQQKGFNVGLADVDIYGPSIPSLLGIDNQRPQMIDNQLVPISCHNIKVMSMAFLVGDDQPAILRGPMITKFIHQFVTGVKWGELDFLILDLPPGTGDAQLSLAQSVPLTGALVVTTPQALSVKVALRGLRMFQKVKVPILGVIENMSGWATPQSDVSPFRGGENLSQTAKVPFLGAIPMDQTVAISGDEGKPLVLDYPDADATAAYRQIATALAQNIASVGPAGGAALGKFRWNLLSGEGAPPTREDTKVPMDPVGRFTPVGMKRAGDNTIEIQWQDGQNHELDFRGLRLACPCASCIDENTGEKILVPSMVPVDIKTIMVEPVGTYALKLTFSDGHSTGLYSFERLRELGEAREKALSAKESQ